MKDINKKSIKELAKFQFFNSSNVLMDANDFRGSFFQKFFGKLRTQHNLSNTAASFPDFKPLQFPVFICNRYNELYQHVSRNNHKELAFYLSTSLFQKAKKQIKDNQIISLNLIPNCTTAKIVQARIYNESGAIASTSDHIWHQLICEFDYQSGQKKYHAVERKLKDAAWRFCYFDL